MGRSIRASAALIVALLAMSGCVGSNADPVPDSSPTIQSSMITSRAAELTTTDGARLDGVLYPASNESRVGVVLSNMGDNDRNKWAPIVADLHDRGYHVLTYSFRYDPADVFTPAFAGATREDLRAGIEYFKSQRIDRIVLIGASLGGMATVKLAKEAGVAAIVVISSPANLTEFGYVVGQAELATPIPKLFIAIENDSVVPLAATRQMYDLAAEPKQWKTFAGTQHGLDLLTTDAGPDLREAVVGFVMTNVPV